MKIIRHPSILLIELFLLTGLTSVRMAAASLTVTGSHTDGIYLKGEPVVWKIATKEDPESTIAKARYKITRDGGQLLRQGEVDLKGGRAEVAITDDQPGVLLMELNAGGDGQPKQHLFGGAVIDPAAVPRSSPRPADFDAFWDAQLAKLAEVPANPELTPVKCDQKGVSHWLVDMDLPRGSKLRGQIARPDAGGRFPAIIQFQYAGVYGLPAWNVTSKAAGGWLAMNVNAHDLPLDESKEFYQKQDAGPLKDYAMIGKDDREKSYFLRMFLACSRAVDYVASRPDWDGRTLVVIGTSQGGLQSVVAAGLNPKVTAMIVNVPAGCDTTAALAGRATAWPYWMNNIGNRDRDAVIRTSSYFDAMNFAPRVKCPSLVAFGLLDRTATASGVYQMANQLGGPVEKLLMTGADHKGTGGTHAGFNARSKEWLASLLESGTPPPETRNLEPSSSSAKPAKPENPALLQIPDVPGLPRVLLIGDSISMGYTLPVRAKLTGRANVHRPAENCADTARGLLRLDDWLGKNRWDVIHFNFGLHDLKYLDSKGTYVNPDQGKQVAPPDVYRARLRELTMRLKATGAKLIFATTTPVPPGTLGRKAGDERIYNQVALEVMKELDVPVDDLCAYVAARQKELPPLPAKGMPTPRMKARPGEIQEPFNVHFTPDGYDRLADLVVSSISASLPPSR